MRHASGAGLSAKWRWTDIENRHAVVGWDQKMRLAPVWAQHHAG